MKQGPKAREEVGEQRLDSKYTYFPLPVPGMASVVGPVPLLGVEPLNMRQSNSLDVSLNHEFPIEQAGTRQELVFGQSVEFSNVSK